MSTRSSSFGLFSIPFRRAETTILLSFSPKSVGPSSSQMKPRVWSEASLMVLDSCVTWLHSFSMISSQRPLGISMDAIAETQKAAPLRTSGSLLSRQKSVPYLMSSQVFSSISFSQSPRRSGSSVLFRMVFLKRMAAICLPEEGKSLLLSWEIISNKN